MVRPFKEALESGEFVFTAEVGPPKGVDIEELLHHIDMLNHKVHALNVTDNQSSVMRLNSLAVSHLIHERGGEPILQMTCRDRNRIALEADALSAYILGIRNVLCLTGDYVSVGDHPEAKPVFDLDSVLLVQTLRKMETGKDLADNDLKGSPRFCVGAIVTPEAKPLEPQLLKFEKKIKAGAEFFQTQAIYDMDKFKRFMDYASKFNVKIMAGIVLLVSAGMARYMNKNVPGIFVPDALVDRLSKAKKGEAIKVGIEIAGEQIRQLKEEKICDGVHIMAIGKEALVPDILAASGAA
jgi:methylenetetrahydrofolate reductase (NADPH)